jgi:predicted Zn-dependent peptidase
MKLTYAQRSAVPVTYVTLSFNAGSAADPVALRGLQALTMDLFTEGTRALSAQQIAEASERLGLSISTTGSPDRSSFTLAAFSDNLAPSLDLLAQILREPAFNEADIDRVKAQTITALRAQMRSPQGIASRAIVAELFGPAAPYGGVATPASIAAIARDDLIAFKDRWIRPDNGEIFVVSDRPLGEIVAALDAALGDWSAPALARGSKDFAALAAGQPTRQRIVLINRPNSPQSFILGAQRAAVDPRDPAWIDFTNANNALGGTFLSRLNMNLRETKGWSYGVRGTPQAYENAVVYGIGGGVQADRTGDALAEMIKETRAFLTERGVTAEELARNVAAEIGELPGSFETSPAVLGAMQTNALYNRPDDYYETLAERYTAQTREALDRAARSALDVDDFVWVVVGNAGKVKPQLEALGLPVELREMESAR